MLIVNDSSCGYLIRNILFDKLFLHFHLAKFNMKLLHCLLDIFRGVRSLNITSGCAKWSFTMNLFLASDW